MIKVKYFRVLKLSFEHALKSYKSLIGLSIFLMTCLVIFAHLWKIASAKLGVSSFNSQELLWYIAFNEWVLVSIPDIQDEMEQDLRSGRLAYLLPRPISYLGSTFMEAIGALMANLIVLGFVTYLFTWWQVGALPFSFMGLSVTGVVGFLAGVVAIIFQMAIGLSAVWLHEVGPFFWIWEKLLFIFGGLMLPLTVYPQWMQTLAHFTPFPVILSDRSALVFNFNISHILILLFSLIGWGIIGLMILTFVYRKGLQILNIEGG